MPPLGGVALSDNDVAAVADLGDCTPEEGLSDAHMSAIGTSATLKRRGSMSASEPFSDISIWRLRRLLTQSGH
jgi:hypothetical protein